MKHQIIKNYAAIVLVLAGLLHLVRVLAHWDLVIGTWFVPAWLSVVAFLIVFYLGYNLYKQK